METRSSGGFGRPLGTIAEARYGGLAERGKQLKEESERLGFTMVGELINDWLVGKIRFVPTGKKTGPLDPQKTLERIGEQGLSVESLKVLQGKSLEEKLVGIRDSVAELVYLLLKGAISPVEMGYVSPAFQDVRGLIDKEELRRRFPEIGELPYFCEGGEKAMIVIWLVDAVVLVIDAVQFSD